MTDVPHSSNLRLHRRTSMPGTWFITKCLMPRRPLLTTPAVATTIVEALRYRAKRGDALVAAFVIMPDHWHILMATDDLAQFMHGLDTWNASHTLDLLHSAHSSWEKSYYETLVSSTKQLVYVCHYIEGNPVRQHLCDRPEEWLWSSAHAQHADFITKPWPWDFAGDHAD
jgi:putative transposase